MRLKRTLIWLIVSLVSIVVFITLFGVDLKHAHEFVARLGIWAPLISVLLYGFLSLTPIPAEPLSFANGALFGPVVGVLVNFFGNNFAAMVEYIIGRDIQASGKTKKKKDTAQLPGFLKKVPVNSVWFLLVGRMIPGYGSKVVSLAGGMYEVPVWRYIWTTAVMNLLGSILLALSGHVAFGLK